MKQQYAHILSDKNEEDLSLEKLIENIVNYYEAIISCMPGNVYWLDKNGKTVGCNKNSLDMFGFKSQAEFKGLNYDDMGKAGNWSDEAIQKCKRDTYKVLETGIPIPNQEDPTIPNAKGDPSYFLTNREPIFNALNEVIGVIGISIDITELKQMQIALKRAKEKAEASKKAKTHFLAVINHELVTPLASILGLLDLLSKVEKPTSQEENIIDAIKNCTHHLLALVNEVSDFNKLETNKYQIRYEAIDLHAMLQEVYNIVKTLSKNKNLDLKVILSPSIPKTIWTDLRVLRQIIMNLVSNAIKFTDKGQITLMVENLPAPIPQKNKVLLKFTVIDTGIGIPNDKLKLIFEPFQQLDDVYTRQSSRNGTGLGLSIADKLSKLLGAKISVHSELGKGSEFSLIGEFGLSENETQTKIIKKKKREVGHFKNSGLRPLVLLIEDDPIVQYIHLKMFQDLGCRVEAISNGKEAIDVFNNHDIIFADISLPDLNGFEVIKAIRQKDMKGVVPIIGLTVYKGKEEKAACIAAGANEFVSKPITQNKLERLLSKYLM